WNAYVTDVDFNDEGMLAAAGSDERLRVYDEDGALLSEMPASQVATGIRFTDENHLVTYSVDGLVRYWQLDRLGAASESNSIFQTASSADRATGVLGVTASELHYTIVDTSGSVPPRDRTGRPRFRHPVLRLGGHVPGRPSRVRRSGRRRDPGVHRSVRSGHRVRREHAGG
ncbi:hypothetical protein KB219_35475, partial [Pseudomonas aeruginosa]|nr:hypothetical protein [Pseudomonas aeruginosa]